MSLTAKVLNTTNPDYDHQAKEYQALYDGGALWHSLKSLWILKHPQEPDKTYDLRLRRATYENNAGPICDMLAGGMFVKPPVIQDFDVPWWEKFSTNVDDDGTPFNVWLQERMVDAMVGGRVYAWLRRPDTDGQVFANLSQQIDSGSLDAFLVTMKAENVIDWKLDALGRLVWLMHREIKSERISIDSGRVDVWTWTFIDNKVVRQWQWRDEERIGETEGQIHVDVADGISEDMVVEELPPSEHGFGEIPVVDLSLTRAMHVIGKLRDPAVGLLNSQEDLDWGLYRGAHALLWVRTKWDSDDPRLGPGEFFRLGRDKEGIDEMGYAEPSGKSFELLANRITQQREGMFRVVHQMAVSADGNATRAQMSGASKEADWKATEVVLSAYAEALKPFIAEVLRIMSRVRSGFQPNGESTPTIGGLAGWHQEDLGSWLLAASQAHEAFRLSETFHRMIAKGQARRLLPHVDEKVMTEIEGEIEAAEVNLDEFQMTDGPFGVGTLGGMGGEGDSTR